MNRSSVMKRAKVVVRFFSSTIHKNIDLFWHIRYVVRHISFVVRSVCLQFIAINDILNFENTLQASLTVHCHDAQTGGFFISGGDYAL